MKNLNSQKMVFDIDQNQHLDVDVPRDPMENVVPKDMNKNVDETSDNVGSTIRFDKALAETVYGTDTFDSGMEPALDTDSLAVSQQLRGMYTKAAELKMKIGQEFKNVETEQNGKFHLHALLAEQGRHFTDIEWFLETALEGLDEESGLFQYCTLHLSNMKTAIQTNEGQQRWVRTAIAESANGSIETMNEDIDQRELEGNDAQNAAEIAAEEARKNLSDNPEKLERELDDIQKKYGPIVEKYQEETKILRNIMTAMEMINDPVLVNADRGSLTVEDLEGSFGDKYRAALEYVNSVRMVDREGDIENISLFLDIEKRVKVLHALEEYKIVLTDLVDTDESEELEKVRSAKNAAFNVGATEREVQTVEQNLGKDFKDLDMTIGAREVLEETTKEMLITLPSAKELTDLNYGGFITDINTVYNNVMNYEDLVKEFLTQEEINKAKDLYLKVEKLEDFQKVFMAFQTIDPNLKKDWRNSKMIKVRKSISRESFTEMFADYEGFIKKLTIVSQKYYGEGALESLMQELNILDEFQEELEAANPEYTDMIEIAKKVLEKRATLLPQVVATEKALELQ
jgi:hypothetical protein